VSVTAATSALLRDRAAEVLRGNDAGSWTKASPHLYPHQWSWDSAFNAIGWANLDVRRAMAELEGLFAAQWSTGMVPHIVFRAAPSEPYFPGPEWWDCANAPAAPAPPVQTTGICQPPVHALALQRIWQLTPEPQRPEIRARLQALYPRLVKWHRYLATQRDPEASGLVTVYHPWEGTDNSPRWDHALARLKVAKPRPYTRLDTKQVVDPSQRPTDWDYDRYLWLVGLLRKYRYDDAEIYRRYPFLIKDVFFSAVLVAANSALLDLAGVAGASDGDRGQLARWLDRGREGLAGCFDTESGLCLDYDVRNEEHGVMPRCGCWTPGTSAATRSCDGACCRARARPSPRSSRATTGVARSGRSSTGCCGTRCASSATPIARTSCAATRSARSPRPGNSPSISSRSPASRSARRSSPGRPPSRWTGWPPSRRTRRPPVTGARPRP
jgi:hypothetical protein